MLYEVITRAGGTFRHISEGIQQVSSIFREVVTGVEEMSQGTGDILREIAGIVETSGKAGEAMEKLTSVNRMNSGKFSEVVSQSAAVMETIEEINSMFSDIKIEAEKVDSIGRENVNQLGVFRDRMKSIKR